MGKKKKAQLFVIKPWCWYCEREFEDEKVLLQHQKSKHFKCQLCPRKLNTAGGLMVHSQQVHKCEPEPLTNTLPGRDGYDIEIFGMEGVPTNALAEWKARKEADAGSAALAAAAAAKRPRHSYVVIPEADLMMALEQHKALMAARNNPRSQMPFPPFPPSAGMPFPPVMPPPNVPLMRFPDPMAPPPPTLPINGGLPPASYDSARPHFNGLNAPGIPGMPQVPPAPVFVASSLNTQENSVTIQPPKDGVMWPDVSASPAEKRAQQSRYRYVSPTPDGVNGDEAGMARKRKAAADFL